MLIKPGKPAKGAATVTIVSEDNTGIYECKENIEWIMDEIGEGIWTPLSFAALCLERLNTPSFLELSLFWVDPSVATLVYEGSHDDETRPVYALSGRMPAMVPLPQPADPSRLVNLFTFRGMVMRLDPADVRKTAISECEGTKIAPPRPGWIYPDLRPYRAVQPAANIDPPVQHRRKGRWGF